MDSMLEKQKSNAECESSDGVVHPFIDSRPRFIAFSGSSYCFPYASLDHYCLLTPNSTL